MSKKSLISLMIAFVLSTSAQSETLVYQSLIALMTKNPICEANDGEKHHVVSLIAPVMLSEFDSEGRGWLSVSDNTCEVVLGNVACRLFILNSQKIHDQSTNSYLPTPEMLESALIIDYMFDKENFELLTTECFFAG